jgi:hypothetical protein
MSGEKKKPARSEGLRLRALDLHVHTPASHDFQDKNLPLEEIVKSAKKAGLDGIAVTDHNVVSAIDEIKKIAQRHQLAIFPGFEISCHGAEKGPIHVIGIFDPTKSQADLERVLGKLDIKKTGEESLTSKSVTDVVNIIKECDGLPVLAHANSSHGALCDIRGNPRIDLVQNPNLLAVEATGSDFDKPVGSRLVDLNRPKHDFSCIRVRGVPNVGVQFRGVDICFEDGLRVPGHHVQVLRNHKVGRK